MGAPETTTAPAPPAHAPAVVRALYVHVPYCHTICGYCDFYSQTLESDSVPALVDHLLLELERWRARVTLRPETIFVGGGTPTTLAPPQLRRLLSALRAAAGGAPVEFTVEANPATVTDRVAEVLSAAGVTRISVGAQSFEPSELRTLERIHRVEHVAQTVNAARRAGIRQVNLDLIFGIPGQTLASWHATLEAALALRPDHLSCYGLTYEPGTPLFEHRAAGRVVPVTDDLEAEMYEATIERLTAAGFEHYEISNFARPGARCRHNLIYWRNEACVGVGPSAAGLVEGVRYRNVPDTAAWAEALDAGRSPWIEHETLDPRRRAGESMMLGLRLIDGVRRADFAERFGCDPLELFSGAAECHVACGLLEVGRDRLRLTRRGLLVADTVLADFL